MEDALEASRNFRPICGALISSDSRNFMFLRSFALPSTSFMEIYKTLREPLENLLLASEIPMKLTEASRSLKNDEISINTM